MIHCRYVAFCEDLTKKVSLLRIRNKLVLSSCYMLKLFRYEVLCSQLRCYLQTAVLMTLLLNYLSYIKAIK